MTEQAKVNSQGAAPENLSDGQGREGAPKPPVVNNAPPVTEITTSQIEARVNEQQSSSAQEATTETPESPPAEIVQENAQDWPQYSDASLAAAVSVFKEGGLNVTDGSKFFEKALASGKLEDVDVAGLEAKLGKEKATLAMAGIRDYYNRQVKLADETVKLVHGVVGGKEAFDKIASWANTKAQSDKVFAKELAQIRDLIDQGGVSARAAVVDLMRQYQAAPNTTGLQTKMLDGNKGVQPAEELKPITRKQYLEGLKQAHKDGNKRMINQLNEQRKLGIAAKI